MRLRRYNRDRSGTALPDPQLAQDPTALAQSLGASFRAIFEHHTETRSPRLRGRRVRSLQRDRRVDRAAVCGRPSKSSSTWSRLAMLRIRFDGLINRAIIYPLVAGALRKADPQSARARISACPALFVQRIEAAPRRASSSACIAGRRSSHRRDAALPGASGPSKLCRSRTGQISVRSSPRCSDRCSST